MPRASRALVWVAALLTFAFLGLLTGFFSLGKLVPLTTDMNPGLYSEIAYSFPPRAWFSNNYWLGQMQMPQDFQPMSLLARLPAWIFFSGYYPLFAALSLLAGYAFLREFGFRRGAALLGGLLYAWQGDLFSTILAGHFSSATVWFFYAFSAWLGLRSLRMGNWFLAACAGVGTGMMVSLLPDRGGLCSLVVGAFLLVAVWRERENARRAATRLGQLALIVVVAVLVASPGIISTLSWTAVNAGPAGVETPREKYDWATQWSYTPEDILNYALPGFMGWRNDYDRGPYWGRIGRSSGWENEHQGMRNFCLAIFTLGTVGFVLAIAGGVLVFHPAVRSGKGGIPPEWIFYGRLAAVTVVVGWLLALGKYGPLFNWFYLLPYMDTWRNPVKFLAPLSLPLVFLAGLAAHLAAGLLDRSGEDKSLELRIQRLFFLVLLVLGIVWLLSFPAKLPGTIGLLRLDFSYGEITTIFSTLRKSIVMAVASLVFVAFTWKLFVKPAADRAHEFINPLLQRVWNVFVAAENSGRSWLAVAGIAVVFQMFWVQTHYVELFDMHHFYRTNPLIKKLKPAPDAPFRVTIDLMDGTLRQLLSTTFPYHGIQCIDIPAASRMPDDYKVFFKTLAENHTRLFQLGGVKYLAVAMDSLSGVQEDPALKPLLGPIEYFVLRPSDPPAPTHAVVEIKGSLPKVSLFTRVDVLPDDGEVLKRLADPKWNPLESVLISTEYAAVAKPKSTATPTGAKLASKTELLHYDGRRIEVDVESPQAAVLLIDDRYDPLWKATINGESATIFPADFILRGVAVPAGRSHVVLTYDVPLPFHWVQIYTLAAVAAWGLFVISRRLLHPQSE